MISLLENLVHNSALARWIAYIFQRAIILSMPDKYVEEDEDRVEPSSALREAYIKLIVDIMFHAIKDKRDGDISEDGFADDDHRTFCIMNGFRCGDDELVEFAQSEWFERLFDELEQTKLDDVRAILLGHCA